MAALARELEVTLEVIRAAGGEILRLYESFAEVADAPADISTEADRRSQEVILETLHREFPADGLCGEEATTLARYQSTSGRIWIVDPIDGTRGFAVKNGEFSVMIGLVDRGRPVLGAVYEPVEDRVTYAVAGQGCFEWYSVDGVAARVGVTGTNDLARAVLSISRSQQDAGERRLLEAFGACRAVRTYSAGIKLAQVARGETDLYLGDYLTLKDWDVCAGHLLVEEAGGTVTNIHGAPIAYDGTGKSLRGQGLLASNGRLHAAALQVLATGKYTF